MTAAGRFATATATTAASTNATADADITVTAANKALLDTLGVKVDVTNNEVTLFVDSVQVWELLTNVVAEQIIDLKTRYPRGLQSDTKITAKVRTTEAVAKTVTLRAWLNELETA